MRLPAFFQNQKHSHQIKLAHALRGVPLFREVAAQDLLTIWDCLGEVEIPAGALVCQRGEPGDRFYVIKSGTVEVRLGLEEAGFPIRRLGAGDFFGEIALLTSAPRSADVVALEETVLWILERSDFEKLLATSLPLLRAINAVLCDLVDKLTLSLEESEATRGRGMEGMRFGPYRVVEQIGVGGMAVVYSATHSDSETAAAVKVLPAAWGKAPELRERLEREADLLQRIHHQNVINVLEVGEVEANLGGGCYLAMEWLPHALDRVLRAQYPEPLAAARALRIAHSIAEGLIAVHAAGLVHRDVKPSNIMLRADGSPVLTDFGLATALSEVARKGRLTPSNVIVGTADYLSPEQVAGGRVDGRADIYSLGVVLYEMLAGYVPFAGRDPIETLQAHMEETPPPLPPSVEPALGAVVEQTLQKNPKDRFVSAAAMAKVLNETLDEIG